MITKDLGAVTAYAYAVEGGYTGTEEEFTQLMADLGITVDEFEHFSVSVSTLPAGSSATASYSDGVLSLGIPKGDKGDTGNTGATGATPNLSIGTVETTAEPSVTITGTVDNPVLNFGLVKGDKGETGEVSEAELTQAFEDFSANGTVANAEQLTTDIRANDQTPYLFRTAGGSVDIGDREYINGIVGGTVAWNQLCNVRKNYSTSNNGVSLTTDADGKITIVVSSGRTTAADFILTLSEIPAVANHVYAVGETTGALDSYYEYSLGTYFTSFNNVINNQFKIAKPTTAGRILVFFVGTNVPAGTYHLCYQTFDLTLALGSTIADYIYSLEQATAGAGVAFFRTLFPKPYYAYNAGELMSVKGLVSHDMVGFNAYNHETGKAKLLGGHSYQITGAYTALSYSTGETITPNSSGIFTPTDDGELTVTGGNGTTTCVHLTWDGSRNGEYEPYQKWSYPLDSDLELRGIPKIENGNLYYDGDVYEADGTVTRKYGVVDLGTLSWAAPYTNGRTYAVGWTNAKPIASGSEIGNLVSDKYIAVNPSSWYSGSNISGVAILGAGYGSNGGLGVVDPSFANKTTTEIKTALSGIYLVYELATPTTETADPYTSPQIVNDFGTEEFVISNTVDVPIPVGHDTDYPINLKAKLEMAPNSPDGDGDYIVRQTNGTNEYVALANNATIQNILARLTALEN